MRSHILSFLVVLSLVAAQTSAQTVITITGGTWSEDYSGGGPGQAGNVVTATITGTDGWVISLPSALLSSFNGGSGTVDDPYDTDYAVSTPPVVMTDGSRVLMFSSLTLNNKTVSAPAPQTFTLTTGGTCDAGCYSMSLTVTGEETASDASGHSGTITGGTITVTLLKAFEGTWCETFGPEGPGSVGGTLTASMSGSGWTINLPNAIHQGVVSGTGTPGDPWVSHYQVDPTQPATVKYGSIVCVFSSLTLVNRNVSGTATFELTASGVCDAGCYQLDLTVCGTVDMSTASSSGMCGSLCGDASLTLLKAFEGTWCETFGPEGPGSVGGTLTASMSGSGWTINLPNAIHQGVVSGTGTPGDPWVSHYQVDPTQPATVKYGSIVCYFSSLTLVNHNVSGVPVFEVTAEGICDIECYKFDLTICGTVDMSTASSSGMCGSLCGDASLSLLRTLEGTWCETFGPEGPGSAGGTLTASMSGSGWTINLPNAIHQGVVSGTGTPGDPWVSHYQVDPTQPATLQVDSRLIKFSSLTLINRNVSGVPTFELTTSGLDDSGCYLLDLIVHGAVDQSTVGSTGMCGSLCGEGTLKVTLTVSSSVGGVAVLPGEKTFIYDYGTQLLLEARVADPLFEFLGWRGTLFSSRNPELLTLYTCHDVRAVFVSLLDVIYVDDDAPADPGPNDPAVSDPLENGTPEHPFDSIQEAVEVARDGATVVVKSGTYRENVVIEDKSITVTSIDPDGTGAPEFPTIRGSYQGPVVSVMLRVGNSTAFAPELVGLVLTGGSHDHYGGIFCRGGSPVFRNCLIVGNCSSLSGGAAMFCEQSSPVLLNCTLADNLNPLGHGAGIYCVDSHLTVGNSIIWNNVPANILLQGNSTATISYSDVQGGFVGEGNFSSDPLFVAPGHWDDLGLSGPVWTPGDYQLAAGSPCIGAGDASNDIGTYGVME
jgi:hypothetical protein